MANETTLSSLMGQVFSEKLGQIFSKHDIPVHSKPSYTLVYPKTPKNKLNNVVEEPPRRDKTQMHKVTLLRTPLFSF